MMGIMGRKQVAGFSLVEVVIAAALLVAVFTVFGTFLLKLTRSAAEISETSKVTEDAGFSVNRLRTDLERTGRGLAVSDSQPFAGSVVPTFFPNSDYQQIGTTINRIANGSNAALQSALQFRGNAAFQATGVTFDVTAGEVGNPSISRRIYRLWGQNGTEIINIYLNGQLETTVTNQGVPPTAAMSISFTSADGGNANNCLVAFRLRSVLIYQNSVGCSDTYQEILAQMPVGNGLTNLELAATEIGRRDAGNDAVRLALLPVYDGTRMISPLISNPNGFVILGGDPRKDVVVLAQDASITANYFGNGQDILVNGSTGTVPGDVLLLCDFVNDRSVLLKVNQVAGKILTVKSIFYQGQEQTRGFANFNSDPTDFLGFTFRRGAIVVNLASPVEYKTELTGLFRRTEGSAWELVLPDVANFSLLTNTQSSITNFEVSFEVSSEGQASLQSMNKVRLAVSPRALNRTFDVR